ncbi:hypothetical protein [Deinococcus sp. JMULE3]|uniref:hypothetical protein n=1 Tax=Deinococcus sp. JMULE3 TaxID=2518341 RepID=UPI001575AFAA|nr:hypothetical protein [Deinococcus sp. JMULE3]NTY02611.1 hypothetical protein [Deinococcus sp. JMULE3]
MLLTYLTLTGRPQHRSAVARLLWPQSDGLQNLRVELTMLRRQGTEVAPPKAPLLHAVLPTDLDAWEADWHAPLDGWLARAQLPLTGLDDPALPEWTAWLTDQRAALLDRVRQALATRAELSAGRADNLGLIRACAQRLNVTLPERPVPPGAVGSLLNRAGQVPQVLLQVGRPGSGRLRTVQEALQSGGWTPVTVSGAASSAHLLASLVLQVRPLLSGDAQDHADRVLAGASDPEQDLVRLSPLLARLGRPVAFVIRNAERLDGRSVRLLSFLLNWPAALMVVLICTPPAAPHLRRQLEALGVGDRLLVQDTPLPAPQDLAPLLPHAAPGGALELWRQSEGWWPAARAIAPHLSAWNRRVRLPPELRAGLLAEVESALPGSADALARLAALPAPFTAAAATAALGADAGIVREALREGLLVFSPERITVTLPDLTPDRPVDRDLPVAFRSELQRAALAGQLSAADRLALRGGPAQPTDRAEVTGAWHSELRAASGTQAAVGDAAPRALGGGYHLVRDGQGFSVVRLGGPGAPPRLTVRAEPPGAGLYRWTAVLHVQSDRAQVPVTIRTRPPGALHDERIECPQDTWVEFTGLSDGSPVDLECAAANLTVTVAQFTYRAALGLLTPSDSAS